METCEHHTEMRVDIKELKEDVSAIKTSTEVTKNTILSLEKRVNGSIEAIRDHIKSGSSWRGTIIGVIVTLAVQTGTFVFFYGRLDKQVEINTLKWEKVDHSFYGGIDHDGKKRLLP